jgi:hypothetical protein
MKGEEEIKNRILLKKEGKLSVRFVGLTGGGGKYLYLSGRDAVYFNKSFKYFPQSLETLKNLL